MSPYATRPVFASPRRCVLLLFAVAPRRSPPLSVDMAQRLSRIFGNSPQFWLNTQQAVDLWDTFEARSMKTQAAA
jgi:hypothetical protein